jgi:peptide/nickel transport system permease protein
VPLLLATDALVWLLVAATIGYVVYCRRHAHLKSAWHRVFQSRAAMASITVLLGFAFIGLLDSLHFRPALAEQAKDAKAAYSTEVLSLLDVSFARLRGRGEKTYSAPLATRSYAKEQVELPEGKHAREFPRLRFGGSHLKDESEWAGDVASKALAGLGLAIVLTPVLWLCFRGLRRLAPSIPWNASLTALLVFLFLLCPALVLSVGYHVFGTDKVGQDIFYLAFKSIRTSIVIGTLTTMILLPVGIALGMMAGYFKGWVDDVIQYVYTTLASIPGILLIAASVLMINVYLDRNADLFPTAAQRADIKLLALCIILGFTSWTGLARLLRGETLKVSELEYVQAAHAFGVARARVLARHVLPNISHLVIIILALDFSGFVLAEAVLSYVGVGVDPSTNSFGTMINAARLEMSREPVVWWALTTAFVFMLSLVLAANLFADAVRDGFDPRVRI